MGGMVIHHPLSPRELTEEVVVTAEEDVQTHLNVVAVLVLP